MTIPEMQKAILKAGWQFNEHVFNDGYYQDCYIKFSQSRSPHVFNTYPVDEESRKERDGNIGWGRFKRQDAWERAYQYIIVEKKYDSKVPDRVLQQDQCTGIQARPVYGLLLSSEEDG